MELIDVLQQIVGRYLKGAALTDLVIGTVTKAAPLEVTEQNVRDPIPAGALLLTAPVVEKKLTALKHSHRAGDTNTDEKLGDTVCLENGKALPVLDGYILLNRGLEVGDGVLMLRVLGGQSYLVLSRIY